MSSQRPGDGPRAMVGAVATITGSLWSGSVEPLDGEDLPRRYTPLTVIAMTVVAVALVAAVTGVRLVIGGPAVSPFWLVLSVVTVVPVLLAFATRPPRRWPALAAGLGAGVAAGAAVGVLLPVPAQWALSAALAVGVVTLSVVFSLVTRAPVESAAHP